MPDWSSQGEVQLDAEALLKLTHVLMGVYVWEWFLTIDFDWELITGKRPFRWPIAFYFANRYLLFFALIGILISFDTTTKLNCQAIYVFNQLAGNASVGLASINLSLRTLAVYGNSRLLAVILAIAILGHWSLILQGGPSDSNLCIRERAPLITTTILAGVLLRAVWNDQSHQCVIVFTNNTVLAATLIYTMVLDLFVFLLNAHKLYPRKGSLSSMGESRLGRLLFGDGLVYFFIAFLSNLLATVFMLLNLNSIMTVIFNVPAAICSTIVACRVVRRLSAFTAGGPEMLIPAVSMLHATSGCNHHDIESGVRVQMETYTHTEMVGEHTTHTGNPRHTSIEIGLRYDESEDTEDAKDQYDDDEGAKAVAL
ncbi:hypothetical protein F5878DRAFT_547618 [Lentinula raphanica]|uniref:Transmembrane protein n=1 Tax=Lentinula raphanica TaxID=153919 RepID=A0AA38NY52_9AGAR|nr:hypothetical protein F5878DRAFT_547618 [Lentinula raphanica]